MKERGACEGVQCGGWTKQLRGRWSVTQRRRTPGSTGSETSKVKVAHLGGWKHDGCRDDVDGAAEIARRSCARWEEGVGGEVRERAGGEQRGARGERAQGSPATAARQRGEKVSRRKGFAVYFAKCEQTRGAGQASDGEERGRAQKEWMLHWSEPASPELNRPPLRTPIPGPLPRPGTLPDPLAPPRPPARSLLHPSTAFRPVTGN